MASHESEQPNNSPLSPNVVQCFVTACANINKYGEHIRAKRIVLDELDIVDDRLRVNENIDIEVATHQASGKMHTSPFDLTMYQVELWTPLESVTPRKVMLLGQEVILKTVMRDGLSNNETLRSLGNVRSVITTAENRMFEITTNDVNQNYHSIREYRADTQVLINTDILTAFAHDLNEGYPDISKRHP